MASTKSLEDMLLSSDIDESAVSALVGSLESQLSSSEAHYPRNEISAAANANHIADGQKHGALLGSLLEQGSNSNATKNTQILGQNAVIVSLPGALPASGYLNQVNSARQHNSNADIKLVYSTQHNTSPAIASSVITSGAARNNLKSAPLHNGSPNFATPAATTMSAIHNLANVASQQPRIQVAPQPLTQQQINALNAKNMTIRTPVDPKSKPQNSDQRHSNSPGIPNHYQVLSTPTTVISTSKPTQVSQISGQPVNVVTQVANVLPPGVQILNVNPTRFAQKTLAPRSVVVGNQVRIAPQMLRQGTPIQVPGQGAITLPASMRSALVVRADGSQYHVFNVASPGLQPGAPGSQNATYRLQSLPAGVPSIIRTISPQQVMSLPVSSSAVKTIQAPHTVVSTILQQTTTSSTATRNNSVNSTQSSSSSAMSPNTIKKKCQNFLSTLIKLAGDQTSRTASNVKKLIQNLIDEVIEPEEFSTQLQKELRSSPQPYLIHFLKKSLPDVRTALMTKEMTIEGIRPPPLPTPVQTATTTVAAQVGGIRPVLAAANRSVAPSVTGSALTAQLSQPPGSTLLTQRLISPQVPHGQLRPGMPTTLAMSASYNSISAASPATVGALQSKGIVPKHSTIIKPTSAAKDKKTFSSVRDDDDINDVAAMGGVNLIEESQRILASNSNLVGTQIRSCKDDTHFTASALHRRIHKLARHWGVEDVRNDVVDLISHAAEQRLKTLIEKVGVAAEHRVENPKTDPRYEVTGDAKAQIKFLEELDKLEKKRHDDQEREILMKAAKSRSKLEDPEQLKLKQKAKEMQRAEIEEMRQREANMTALLAIGPRKKLKGDPQAILASQVGNSGLSNSSNTNLKAPVRPRVKRVNLRDLLFVMENEHRTVRRPLLYKYYAR